MDKHLIALLAFALVLPARAQNKPFNTRNGRTVTGGGGGGGGAAPARSYNAVVRAGAGAPAYAPPQESAVAAAAPSAAGVANGPLLDGGRSFMGRVSGGGHRAAVGRAVRRGGSQPFAAGGRRVDYAPAEGGAAGGGAEAPQEAPGYHKYGAKILSEGQAPQYAPATTREHAQDAGQIVIKDKFAGHVARAPSLQHGPKDTPPPCTPGTPGCNGGGSAGGNSITPNAPATGGSGSGSGQGGGNGNGGDSHQNDNGDGNGNGDGHGGGKGSNEDLQADPTGFGSSF